MCHLVAHNSSILDHLPVDPAIITRAPFPQGFFAPGIPRLHLSSSSSRSEPPPIQQVFPRISSQSGKQGRQEGSPTNEQNGFRDGSRSFRLSLHRLGSPLPGRQREIERQSVSQNIHTHNRLLLRFSAVVSTCDTLSLGAPNDPLLYLETFASFRNAHCVFVSSVAFLFGKREKSRSEHKTVEELVAEKVHFQLGTVPETFGIAFPNLQIIVSHALSLI